jgi:YbgC/YbaW family acyl-CoA thioester hydrolase
MNMIFRFFWLILRSRHRPRLNIWDTGRVSFRVRLRDIDLLRHMNNSVHLAVMDLGRMDLVIRAGFWQRMKEHDVFSVVANQTITYRKSLKLGDRFEIETRIAGVDDKAAYFEQRFVVNGTVYAEAVVRQRFIRRRAGSLAMAELMTWVDPIPEDRVLAPWIGDWAANAAPRLETASRAG